MTIALFSPHEKRRDFKYIKCRSYRNFDNKRFQDSIDKISSESVLEATDVDSATAEFRLKLIEVVDKHAPMRHLKMRLCAPEWLNGEYLATSDERAFWAHKFDKCSCVFHFER